MRTWEHSEGCIIGTSGERLEEVIEKGSAVRSGLKLWFLPPANKKSRGQRVALNKCRFIGQKSDGVNVGKTADPDQGCHQVLNSTVTNFVPTL